MPAGERVLVVGATQGTGSLVVRHAGVPREAPAGTHPVQIGQKPYRMSLLHRIGREDVAEVFAQALPRPRTRNTTFDAVWGRGSAPTDWDAAFAALVPDR